MKPKQTNPTERTTVIRGKALGGRIKPVARYIAVDYFTIVWYNQFDKSGFAEENTYEIQRNAYCC